MERNQYKIGFLLAIGLFAWLLVSPARSDTITLKDGKSVNGSFYRQGDKYVIEPYKGTAFTVPIRDLTGIILAPNPASKQAKGHQWNLIKYRISRSSNLPLILKMLRKFIAANPHSNSLAQAHNELIRYRQYQKLHLIRIGQKWLSPSELASIRHRVNNLLKTAVQLYAHGRLMQSLQAAKHAILLLPTSAHAWIVAGVIEYRLNHLPAARHSFAHALKLEPNNISALNDSAILNFKTHMQPRSLVLFGKALAIDAGNRQLLDNIYATLRAYKANRKSPLFAKLRRSFKSADHAMQVRLARRGLYRVGGTWVNRKVYKKIATKLAAYEQQKQTLQANYDSTILALKSVNAQLRQTNAQITNLQNVIGSLQIQQNFLAYQTGYYDYGAQAALNMNLATLAQAQAHVLKLQNQRIAILAGLANIRAQAKAFQKSGPGVVLDGRQKMLFPQKVAPIPEPLAIPIHMHHTHGTIGAN